MRKSGVTRPGIEPGSPCGRISPNNGRKISIEKFISSVTLPDMTSALPITTALIIKCRSYQGLETWETAIKGYGFKVTLRRVADGKTARQSSVLRVEELRQVNIEEESALELTCLKATNSQNNYRAKMIPKLLEVNPERITWLQWNLVPRESVMRECAKRSRLPYPRDTSVYPRQTATKVYEEQGGRGARVAEWLASSPPTKANRVRSPDFRKWESCRTMPLVGGFSRGSPVSPPSHSDAAL
ncbi:hypothetical protein PR048_015453 [Dryococelus australis]|uniref:Uncharacterized protein n=1 Tax=Dryococelus australis TaxID=614101 RepID=A0ABQ9HH32_9NEOP|nr:hypothetical protein PR048_015453 [Dryococelus australis]